MKNFSRFLTFILFNVIFTFLFHGSLAMEMPEEHKKRNRSPNSEESEGHKKPKLQAGTHHILNLQPRRLENYTSFPEYLKQCEHQRSKILIIGGALIYDDLVPHSENKFSNTPENRKNRLKYYPSCAYLVDKDGQSQIGGQNVSTHSDDHFDISTTSKPALLNQFNIIILEYLYAESLTEKTFKNIFLMLKDKGVIILNNPAFNFTVDINDFKWITRSSDEGSSSYGEESKNNSPSQGSESSFDIESPDIFINNHMNLVKEERLKNNIVKIYLPKERYVNKSSFLGLEDLKYYIHTTPLSEAENVTEADIQNLIKAMLKDPKISDYLKTIIFYWLLEEGLSVNIEFSYSPPQDWYAQDAGWGYLSITKK